MIGVDLSAESVAAATRAAEEAGLAELVRFVVGDAEALPLADASADGALCECALCTFPDKEAAARELARVLAPAGRLALSDVTADRAGLPEGLTSLEAWVACLGALPLDGIAGLLEASGLVVEATAREDAALEALLDRAEPRLRAARLLVGDLADRGLELVALARGAVGAGALGYGVVVARKQYPQPLLRQGTTIVAVRNSRFPFWSFMSKVTL